MTIAPFLFILLCIHSVFASSEFDLVAYAPVDPSSQSVDSHLIGRYKSTGRPFSAYLGLAASPHYAGGAPPVRIAGGCDTLRKTSESAVRDGCHYAVNAGFFNFSPVAGSYCIGNLVMNGTVVSRDYTRVSHAQFAITRTGSVFGYLDLDSFRLQRGLPLELVAGRGWLVRRGVSNLGQSPDVSGSFVTEKAPRTAIGTFANGTVAVLQVDGDESTNEGPDLYEMTELLISLGFVQAINLDGGGSSVTVRDGKVVDVPTCNDTPVSCERSTSTIICFKS